MDPFFLETICAFVLKGTRICHNIFTTYIYIYIIVLVIYTVYNLYAHMFFLLVRFFINSLPTYHYSQDPRHGQSGDSPEGFNFKKWRVSKK